MAGPADPDAFHRDMMRRALVRARLGRGTVEPNPMVGAVLVKDGVVVAEGHHARFGGPHAEIEVLRAAPPDLARGADIYVTLEPCSTFGKTPPCTDALIAAGVRRVFFGVADPNPAHAGRGFDQLRAQKIEVHGPILEDEALALLDGFRRHLAGKTPFVVAKWAQTLDGRIATRTGESKWITGEEARRAGHEERARADGILVGVGTILADDPELTTRLVAGKSPRRFVLDSHLRTPASAKINDTSKVPTTFFVAADDLEVEARIAERRGPEFVRTPRAADGRLDLRWILERLRQSGVNRLMIEGGPTVLGSFVGAALVDYVRVFLAPILIGDAAARAALDGPAAPALAGLPRLSGMSFAAIGADVMITGALDKRV